MPVPVNQVYLDWIAKYKTWERRDEAGVTQVRVPRLGWVKDFGTFREDTGTPKLHLPYAVPAPMRGKWYDKDEKVRRCKAQRVQPEPGRCEGKAYHRTPLCSMHGGALHPEDPRPFRGTAQRHGIWADPKQKKWERFIAGEIDVSDLDDEELLRCQLRDDNGNFTGVAPKWVPREVHDRLVRELFNRADQKLKENLLDVVDTMTSMAIDKAVEPKDRIKAAQWVYERVRGKVPDVTVTVNAEPWKDLLANVTKIQGGSREESRAARASLEKDNPIDAEFEEEDDPNE